MTVAKNLIDHYKRLSPLELGELVKKGKDLTPEAIEALKEELSRRGIEEEQVLRLVEDAEDAVIITHQKRKKANRKSLAKIIKFAGIFWLMLVAGVTAKNISHIFLEESGLLFLFGSGAIGFGLVLLAVKIEKQ